MASVQLQSNACTGSNDYSPMTSRLNAYLQWNDALASHFFNSEVAGRNVYLSVSQGLISETKEQLGPGILEFVSAVKRGPPWGYAYGQDVCQRALATFWNWRRHDLEFPPYIGYLSLFVLAAGADGDFHPNAYYPRLRDLLGESGEGMYPSFDHMSQLWDDLQVWAIVDRQGELGSFESRTVGGHRHIGYPISQSILAEQDRRYLPQVFYIAGLDPATNHPPSELAMALRSSTGRRHLRPRTVRLAENPADTLHRALMNSVADELSSWDGTVEDSQPDSGGIHRVFGGLRVCLSLDTVSGVASAFLRCKLNREYPETGLTFEYGLRADEDVNGWSLPVTYDSTGENFDASQIDWSKGVTIRATPHDYQLKLPGHRVKIFISGASEGISGLVDANVVPQGQRFYLCYPEDAWRLLERWARTQCLGFNEIDVVRGLPKSWHLASIEAALDDEAVRDAFPMLAFDRGVRLHLVGGLRSGAGSNFFSFAPPLIELIGGEPGTEVYCGDELLSTVAAGNSLTLPSDIPIGSPITVEARSGPTVTKRSLYLTDDFGLPISEPSLLLDTAGRVAGHDSSGPLVAGAYIKNPPSMATYFHRRALSRSRTSNGSRPRISCRPAPWGDS